MSESIPRRVAQSLDEARDAVSFARYMERCLFDPEWGYYSSGKVVFGEGEGKHFWTYPQRMSPLFGWMLAELAVRQHAQMDADGQLDPERPFHLLELGAGNGDLARDTLDYLAQRAEQPRYAALAQQIRYVIGERSAALRERQRERLGSHLEEGRAEVREVDAQALSWEGPFQGIVFANELLDAFPCERLRIHAPGCVHRVHVEGGGSREALWSWVRGERNDVNVKELEVPLKLGWSGGEMPPDLGPYLETLEPLIADLEASGKLPVDLFWGPGVRGFMAGVASVLTGPERCGIAVLVDYGGSSRHVLDPGSMGKHFRVYGARAELAHQESPYVEPSQLDMTWDIDFTEVARLGREVGLESVFLGHQSFLEVPPINLWSKEGQQWLIAGRVKEGITDHFGAVLEAHKLVVRFRLAGGFRAIVLTSPGVTLNPEHLPASDLQGAGRGLATVSAAYDAERFAEQLKAIDLPPEIAEHLKPCGDVVADLCDRGHYAHRFLVMDALEALGWLA